MQPAFRLLQTFSLASSWNPKVGFNRTVVQPLWNGLSPLFLPAWTSAVGISCLQSLLQPHTDALSRIAQGYNLCAATLSTCILVTKPGTVASHELIS